MKKTNRIRLAFNLVLDQGPARVARSVFSRCLSLCIAMHNVLPPPGEEDWSELRMGLGGYLFAEGPLVVSEVVSAMREKPHLFAGYPDAAELEEGQDHAQGWWTLHANLQWLADRCLALYQIERALLNRQAIDILGDAKGRAAGRYASKDDRARWSALVRAADLLDRWHRRKAGKRSRPR